MELMSETEFAIALVVVLVVMLAAAYVLTRALEKLQDWAFDVEGEQLWH